MSQEPSSARVFPSTHWSAVEVAGEEYAKTERPVLSELLRRYLPALRAHLAIRRSVPRDQIDDVLQGFISGKVLESDLIGRADRTKGKFRTFLLTALDRYVVSRQRHDSADKRGGGEKIDTLDAGSELPLAATVESPTGRADTFDIAWARQILRETLARMCAQCEADGRPDVWGVFDCRILKPAMEGAEAPGYEQIVERFGYRAPTQMWNAVRTGKQIFARLLRSVIAEYADSAEQIEAELRDLYEICGHLPRDDAGRAYT